MSDAPSKDVQEALEAILDSLAPEPQPVWINTATRITYDSDSIQWTAIHPMDFYIA